MSQQKSLIASKSGPKPHPPTAPPNPSAYVHATSGSPASDTPAHPSSATPAHRHPAAGSPPPSADDRTSPELHSSTHPPATPECPTYRSSDSDLPAALRCWPSARPSADRPDSAGTSQFAPSHDWQGS